MANSSGDTALRRHPLSGVAWRLVAGLLLSTTAHAAVECAPAGADGMRLCMAGLRPAAIQEIEATQERSNWCWAAVVSMVLRHHGIAAAQQDIVTRSIGAPIDRRLRTREIPAVFEREWALGTGGVGVRTTALSERVHLSDPSVSSAIVDALAADQPLMMSARGHAIVLVGVSYVELPGGGRRVLGGTVIDPLPMQGLRFVQEDEMAPTLLAQVEVQPRRSVQAADRGRAARQAGAVASLPRGRGA